MLDLFGFTLFEIGANFEIGVIRSCPNFSEVPFLEPDAKAVEQV